MCAAHRLPQDESDEEVEQAPPAPPAAEVRTTSKWEDEDDDAPSETPPGMSSVAINPVLDCKKIVLKRLSGTC